MIRTNLGKYIDKTRENNLEYINKDCKDEICNMIENIKLSKDVEYAVGDIIAFDMITIDRNEIIAVGVSNGIRGSKLNVQYNSNDVYKIEIPGIMHKLRFSKDGNYLVANTNINTVLLSTRNWELIEEDRNHHLTSYFSQDSKLMYSNASKSRKAYVNIKDILNNRSIHDIPFENNDMLMTIEHMSMSYNNKYIAMCIRYDHNSEIRILSLDKWNQGSRNPWISIVDLGDVEEMTCIFNPKGSLLFMQGGQASMEVKLLNPFRNEITYMYQDEDPNMDYMGPQFSQDCYYFAYLYYNLVDNNITIVMVDIDGWNILDEISEKDQTITNYAISIDSRYLMVSEGNKIKLFDTSLQLIKDM